MFASRSILTRSLNKIFILRGFTAKTFYDSQSGGHISVGRSATLHDVTFASTKVEEFQTKLENVLSNRFLGSLQVIRTDSRTLDTIQVAGTGEPTPLIFLKADSLPEIQAHKDLKIKLDGYVIEMSMDTMDDNDKLGHMAMIKEAVNHGKQVRVMLKIDLSSNGACAITSGNAIGDLCDVGADIIMLEHDVIAAEGNVIDEDKVRETIEEAFYLDISGSPINQRLGLYTQDMDVMNVAIELGCVHFVTHHDMEETRVTELLSTR